jgi:hypothetical protein
VTVSVTLSRPRLWAPRTGFNRGRSFCSSCRPKFPDRSFQFAGRGSLTNWSKRKELEMNRVHLTEVINIIQNISADDKKMKILISLADSFYKFGQLTEKQELLFRKIQNEVESNDE